MRASTALMRCVTREACHTPRRSPPGFLAPDRRSRERGGRDESALTERRAASGANRHTAGMRLLVIEDEAPLAEAIATGLRAEGFDVDISLDGLDGLWRAQEHAYAAIVC